MKLQIQYDGMAACDYNDIGFANCTPIQYNILKITSEKEVLGMNIYDVAEKAGVSITTVSRVLNGSSKVSDKTLMKVKKVMEELNYMPSQIAVGLATNSTKTIGIMLPDVRDSFHASIAYIIESKMSAKGYTCILCNTSVENNNEADYMNSLYGKKVDGIILVGSSYHKASIDEVYNQWTQKIPIVLINAISVEGTASVVCDEKDGMVQALTHLRQRGYSHPVFMKDQSKYQARTSETKARMFLLAYEEVFQSKELPEIYSCLPDEEEYKKLLKKIKPETIDSILFTNDMSCAIFLKTMEKNGLRAPKDYALIGFNNARITDLTSPTITTIDHLVLEHCEEAINKLFLLMEGQEVEKVTYLKPTLVIKETT